MIDTSSLNGMSLAITDTNVIVYSVDIDADDRHDKAHQLIEKLAAANRLVLTAQVLNETYSVLTRPRRAFRLSPVDAANFVHAYATGHRILPLTAEITIDALDGVEKHGLSFWDALIWATAKLNGIPLIYSEDFQHEREVEGVLFLNPFV